MAIAVISSGAGYIATNLPDHVYESKGAAHTAALQFARDGTVNTTGLVPRREALARQRFASALGRQEAGESGTSRVGRPRGRSRHTGFLAELPEDIQDAARQLAKEDALPPGVYFEALGEDKPGRYLFKRVTKDERVVRAFSVEKYEAEQARALAIAAKLLYEEEHGQLSQRKRMKPAPALPPQP